jgi:hypothetical protein
MHTFITLSRLEVNMGTQVVVGNKGESIILTIDMAETTKEPARVRDIFLEYIDT